VLQTIGGAEPGPPPILGAAQRSVCHLCRPDRNSGWECRSGSVDQLLHHWTVLWTVRREGTLPRRERERGCTASQRQNREVRGQRWPMVRAK